MKHHSKPHGDSRAVSLAAHKVLEKEIRRLRTEIERLKEENEACRQDYERQLHEKAADNWRRNLGTDGLVFREITGSTSKTEKFLSRLAEVMARDNETGKTTAEIVEELARVTGIELEVQE